MSSRWPDPLYTDLCLLSGETVNVAIRNGNEAVLIGQKSANRWSNVRAPLGVVCRYMLPAPEKRCFYPLTEELVGIVDKLRVCGGLRHSEVDLPILPKNLERESA